ncbi:energy-coupling factor transporter ATPase [Candidatus Mycoplasma mahonii]|uniref:energy-coupling factor transporter ATPase n=1 Tax=Candidatus Mycoplasma mahonii TaxID=3004105 RepID=UPI0026EB43A1|nr:energy-coupling factor transporter ATPase [Candidatus Mycoplasma mahonii]WKX02309.1 energy-coupling factor transporter ATPase [Candidatus Mycoplasma mahonii]
MIKIKNLKFKYSDFEKNAIDGVSLEIPDKKYIAILGHNGSGKSTLSKLIVGLYKPTEGYIEINGIKINKNNLRKIRAHIGIVFQNPDNQFIGSTVEDDIAFGLENKNITRSAMKEKIMHFSKLVGMVTHLEHEPQSLSGGQKQRVAIASTLVFDPDIIIFDEVTSMLDPKGKKEIISLIKKIQGEKNKTIISITHDMDEAVLADEIFVFSQGKLVASGPPQDILSNKRITKLAKIDAPFIYKVSSKIDRVKTTYNREELVRELCK